MRNAEKGGGVLMSIILPHLKYSFISPVPVPVPDSGSGFRFRIPVPDSGSRPFNCTNGTSYFRRDVFNLK